MKQKTRKTYIPATIEIFYFTSSYIITDSSTDTGINNEDLKKFIYDDEDSEGWH